MTAHFLCKIGYPWEFAIQIVQDWQWDELFALGKEDSAILQPSAQSAST